jgi:predicted metal-dependent hydrolase
MARILPEDQDFDPESFTRDDARQALAEGLRLFDAGEYHAAHEELERCWLASEGAGEGFYKGLIQAAIAMHHLQRGNYEGARKLYSGHRRLLGGFLPEYLGVDLGAFLGEMQRVMGPVLQGEEPEWDSGARPRVG